jgi:hypothetical protein
MITSCGVSGCSDYIERMTAHYRCMGTCTS